MRETYAHRPSGGSSERPPSTTSRRGRIVISLIIALVAAPGVILFAGGSHWLIAGGFVFLAAGALWRVWTGRVPKAEMPDLSPQAIRRGLQEFLHRFVEDVVRTGLMIAVVVAWGIGLLAGLAGLGMLVAFLAPPDSGLEELLGWVLVLPTVGLLVAGPTLTWRWLGKRGIGGIARRDGRG